MLRLFLEIVLTSPRGRPLVPTDDEEKEWWSPSVGLVEALKGLKEGLARVGVSSRQDDRTARLMGVVAEPTLSNFLTGARGTPRKHVTKPDTVAGRLIAGLGGTAPAQHSDEPAATELECQYWEAHELERSRIRGLLESERRTSRGLPPVNDEGDAARSEPGNPPWLAFGQPWDQERRGSRVRGLASFEASLEAGENYGSDRTVLMVKPFFDRVSVDQPGYEDYEFALGSCRFELQLHDGRVLNGLAGFTRELGNLEVKARGPDDRPYCDVFQKGQGKLLAEKASALERLCDLEPETSAVGVALTFPRSALRLVDPKDRVVSTFGDKIESLVVDWLRRKHLGETDEADIHHIDYAIARRSAGNA